jgi:hypothetical protein
MRNRWSGTAPFDPRQAEMFPELASCEDLDKARKTVADAVPKRPSGMRGVRVRSSRVSPDPAKQRRLDIARAEGAARAIHPDEER